MRRGQRQRQGAMRPETPGERLRGAAGRGVSWILAAIVWTVWGCASPEPPPLPEDPEVVAVFDEGEITRTDVDRAVLAMPAADRQVLAEDLSTRERLAEELVVQRVAVERARLQGDADSPEHLAAVRELERQAHVQQYLREQPIEVRQLSEDELRQRFEEDRERFQTVERRHVLNLFRRTGPELSAEDARVELERLRSQVLSGVSFSSLAKELSDSESRHRGGSIGWVRRGQLAPELEEIMFSLPEGIPSEPLATADGCHLFFVESSMEAREFSFEDARAVLQQELRAELLEAALDERLAELELPAGSFVPELDELQALLSTGDPAVVVLRIGDVQVTSGKLQALVVAETRRTGPGQRTSRPDAMLDRLRRHELIYRERMEEGAELSPAVVRRLEIQAEQLLADRYRRRLMQRRLEADPARLRAFYDDNVARFSGPLRLEIDRLLVPLSEQPGRQMAVLETRRESLDSGQTKLDQLATELGGTVEPLGWKTLAELAAVDPKIPEAVARVAAGEHSVPYRGGEGIEMLAVRDRREPQPLSFEQARARVESAYVERHGAALYDDVRRELLDEVGFRLFSDRLQVAPLESPSSAAGAE